jgi:hypothetical protein
MERFIAVEQKFTVWSGVSEPDEVSGNRVVGVQLRDEIGAAQIRPQIHDLCQSRTIDAGPFAVLDLRPGVRTEEII